MTVAPGRCEAEGRSEFEGERVSAPFFFFGLSLPLPLSLCLSHESPGRAPVPTPIESCSGSSHVSDCEVSGI
ncbi:MAG: hypothetical protein B6A08_17465 [Sorangiineae bacterium NIC37A_2]|nr:MAG: hypothetical protein B6A08_17465 [Sorangiineae bacterium NIC37A_2]